VKRTFAAVLTIGMLAALPVAAARANAPSICPLPWASPASGARVTTASGVRTSPTPTVCPPTDPIEALYKKLEAELGGDIAKALAAQQRLSDALDRVALSEQALSDEVAQEEQRIADLEDQVAQLDTQIQDTQDRIATEKTQVAAMSRTIYRQPHSFIEVLARAGSLHDALVMTADLVVAGQRAHALQAHLSADLAKLQHDRTARLADLDRENGLHDQLVANLGALDDLMNQQSDLSTQLDDIVSQLQDALSGLRDQPPDVTADLAKLLEQEEQDLIRKANELAWLQVQVGAGLAQALGVLPPGRTVDGLTLSWPIAGAHITQPFGPSAFLLEPPLGQYPHFHTGIDLAAAFGTRVNAAANGVVVAVVQSNVGYGNFVAVAHGGGIITMYAHLSETDVKPGQKVVRGQRVGLEGSSGLSTGPHLHFELRVNNQVVDPMRFLPALVGPTTPDA
jgi:murein DD-endopeptidase MepM/ murein hydrolase activator NlpD